MTDTELLNGLRKLCGYVENGSNTSVTIFRDDATRDWVVYVGNRWYWGRDFKETIRKAIDDNQE